LADFSCRIASLQFEFKLVYTPEFGSCPAPFVLFKSASQFCSFNKTSSSLIGFSIRKSRCPLIIRKANYPWQQKPLTMRNWLAGIIAFFGLIFFFFAERNLLGFIVLIICAVVAAILFSEPEMDERIKKVRESDKKRRKNEIDLF